MAKTDKFLVLACDPEEGQWTILMQTDDADKLLDYWNDNEADPSLRITINTADFITFGTEEETPS